jgi:hypothetical protein
MTSQKYRTKKAHIPLLKLRLSPVRMKNLAVKIRGLVGKKERFSAHALAGKLLGVADVRHIDGDALFTGLRSYDLFQCVYCNQWQDVRNESAKESEICSTCDVEHG